MRKKPMFGQLKTVFTLLLPIIYIVLGILLLFIKGINTEIFAELIGAMLMIIGAALIIHYFLSKAYMDLNAYGFSIGALAVILGICILIKSKDVGDGLSVLLNICIMLTAIIKLQNAIQLKFMKSVFWIPVLCVSLAFLACTVLITVNPFSDNNVRDTFTYIVLLCDGVVSFANAILLRIVVRRPPRAPQTTDIIQA
ncbi:MAG: DUF308 domain-containing protein [Oscillospiraceae bacterium]|nr:DUF308 domain-containing protein [Oscillospiraceae bacterium]